jgi:hypothetical protein
VSSEQSIGRQEREERKGALVRSRPEAVWAECARPTRSHVDPPPKKRVLIALLSGALATAVNMAILATLGAAGIRTTHGGLLRLLALGVIRVAHSPGINPTYLTEAQSLFAVAWFQEGFHYRNWPVDGRCLCTFSGTPVRTFTAASRCALRLNYMAP